MTETKRLLPLRPLDSEGEFGGPTPGQVARQTEWEYWEDVAEAEAWWKQQEEETSDAWQEES